MSAGTAPRAARSAVRGRVPLALPAVAMIVVVCVAVVLLLRSAEAAGVGQVDVTRLRLHGPPTWAPAEWRERLEEVLSDVGQVDLLDRPALDALEQRLEALPFIAGLEPLEVRHPASLRIELRFHEPVASVRLGEEFLPVAADGTLLPGWSEAPHEASGLPLPVLAPVPPEWLDEPPLYGCPVQVLCPDECPRHHEHREGTTDEDGEPDSNDPGCTTDDCAARRLEDRQDRSSRGLPPRGRLLSEDKARQRLEAALSVAASMARGSDLPRRARQLLGRVVIDATREAAPDGLPGGVVLLLEERRAILWGRSPLEALAPDAGGELPATTKWRHVAEAAVSLEGPEPWDGLDVRFDQAVREFDPPERDAEGR